jgi:hypothetical protein
MRRIRLFFVDCFHLFVEFEVRERMGMRSLRAI